MDIEIVQLQSVALAPPRKKMCLPLECRIENLRDKHMSGELNIEEYLLIRNSLAN